jgi:prepilin-type N-terminal cleavage/methylation domain-containing protein
MKRRSGFTLIEMLVAIMLVGAALGTIVLALHAVHAADRRVRGAIEFEAQLARLTADFRRDVHNAEAVQSVAIRDAGGVQLTLPQQQTVTYYTTVHGAASELKQADQVLRRASYFLPAAAVAWQITGNADSSQVTCRLSPTGQSPGRLTAQYEARIVANTQLFRHVVPAAIASKAE